MTDLDTLCINSIRMLSADAVEKANSGHPGLPMGAAAMAYALWTQFLRHNPKNPNWPDRDRFVLSAGHGSMLLYSLLYLSGYDLSLSDLENFRQWGSKTPGHPEYGHTPGVETTTGPLGQGLANGVGMAMAERYLAARFNRPGHEIVNHHTYGIVSDGDLMEGISHEAASLAGHLRLGKLIYLYDDNRISIEGSTEISFTEDRAARFAAYGWHVETVRDGNDVAAVSEAIRSARAAGDQPSLIVVRNHIGWGSPNKQDTAGAHGEPLGTEELRLTKENLKWPPEPPFYVPDAALARFRGAVEKGSGIEREWKARVEIYAAEYPELAAEWKQTLSGGLPEGWDRDVRVFPTDPKGMATRVASGTVLNDIAPHLSSIIGGSADLAPSPKTLIRGEDDFRPEAYSGRNIRFGVREHAMGAILNGMALHGGLIPYGATFLVFSDYMRPSMRLAALMGIQTIYVLTHDSIGLGEDGPTHQPIEHLAGLRAIPNLTVIRPCDANETAEAWRHAIAHRSGPVAIVLSRQNLPTLDREEYAPAEGLHRGGYVLLEPTGKRPDVILMATGSEVHIVLEAARRLEKKGVAPRVVSLPSWEIFDLQPEAYRLEVFPPDVPVRISLEAGSTEGWHRFTGSFGTAIGLDHFGASAPAPVLYDAFGITADRVVAAAVDRLEKT
jgi:transketolase